MFATTNVLVTVFLTGLLWADVSVAGGLLDGLSARGGPLASMPAWEARPLQGGISLSQAVALAQGRFPGKVVKAETRQRGGRAEHVVRIINDEGRVRTFRIDAQTGEFR